jgi:hypothetical protein
MKNLIETIVTVTLLAGLPIIIGICVYGCHTNTIHSDTFDKKQIIETKQDKDETGTTQGSTLTYEELLSKEPDCIYYDTIEVIEEDGVRWYTLDTIKMQREADSIDAYMKYWYEVLDTNSNGDIDDTEIKNED